MAFEAGLIIDEAMFVRLEELAVSEMLVTTPVTLQFILGMVFKPLMYLLSVPWDEAQIHEWLAHGENPDARR